MVISDRLRTIREQKDLPQGDIETRTGLKRCYVSRVENGHTVPSVETLEKMARALEVPMYQLFYEGEEPPEIPSLPKSISAGEVEWGSSGESAKFFKRLHQLLTNWSARTAPDSSFRLRRWSSRIATSEAAKQLQAIW
jgi:transcriptional regulator with XRE-family HTH domain